MKRKLTSNTVGQAGVLLKWKRKLKNLLKLLLFILFLLMEVK